jgi:uncharacterized membrane protein
MIQIIYFISFSLLILYIIDIENDINKDKSRIDNWDEIKTIILIIALIPILNTITALYVITCYVQGFLKKINK